MESDFGELKVKTFTGKEVFYPLAKRSSIL